MAGSAWPARSGTGSSAATFRARPRWMARLATLSTHIETDAERQALSDLAFAVAGANITGNVTRTVESGLLDGRLDVDAPNVARAAALLLQKAEGAVTASLVLTPQDGRQGASLSANATDLRSTTSASAKPGSRRRWAISSGAVHRRHGQREHGCGRRRHRRNARGHGQPAGRGDRVRRPGAACRRDHCGPCGALAPLENGYRLSLARLALAQGNLRAQLAQPTELVVQNDSVALSDVRLDVGSGRITASGTAGTTLDLVVDVANLPLSIANTVFAGPWAGRHDQRPGHPYRADQRPRRALRSAGSGADGHGHRTLRHCPGDRHRERYVWRRCRAVGGAVGAGRQRPFGQWFGSRPAFGRRARRAARGIGAACAGQSLRGGARRGAVRHGQFRRPHRRQPGAAHIRRQRAHQQCRLCRPRDQPAPHRHQRRSAARRDHGAHRGAQRQPRDRRQRRGQRHGGPERRLPGQCGGDPVLGALCRQRIVRGDGVRRPDADRKSHGDAAPCRRRDGGAGRYHRAREPRGRGAAHRRGAPGGAARRGPDAGAGAGGPVGAPIPQSRSAGLLLDVRLNAPNQIFVRGRGLDAEVGGSVRLAALSTISSRWAPSR